jgi:hypothetical protein
MPGVALKMGVYQPKHVAMAYFSYQMYPDIKYFNIIAV